MGSWFSSFHVLIKDGITSDMLRNCICGIMAGKQFVSVPSMEEADGAFALVYDEDSRWISVYSDLLFYDECGSFAETAEPISAELDTDVLCISCFDSDYICLNLINKKAKTDAWLGVGSASGLGIKRRTGLSAWKDRVNDFSVFREYAKKKYDFAEDFLGDIASCIGIPEQKSTASYEYLEESGLADKAEYIYFKLPEGQKNRELPKLEQHVYSLMPCFLEKPSTVEAINTGGASKGLSVFFIGSYVEHDEISFSDACFVRWKNKLTEAEPFELQKVQLKDGQWAYYYHAPGFRIPEKVDDRLPNGKREDAEHEQSIIVRFVPHGNPRKILDISVVLVPDENFAGQTGWNVWASFGSKAAFIKHHNDAWSRHKNCERLLLREEDFD